MPSFSSENHGGNQGHQEPDGERLDECEAHVDERIGVELLERFCLAGGLVDLRLRSSGLLHLLHLFVEDLVGDPRRELVVHDFPGRDVAGGGDERDQDPHREPAAERDLPVADVLRSEERRVGKECRL